MGREIKFSLLYRDMWQSSGKYVPTIDMLKKVAPSIIDMGCFRRVETNGGGFEQINLLFGENPNYAVREWTKPFNEAGIETHMLERALNGIRMSPVPAETRKLMYRVKKAQGVDISRSFCGLNDHRNLENSVKFAKETGMISQVALSITHSDLHTIEYYMEIVDKVIEYGADEIALKDMAGIGRPVFLGKLTKSIKSKYPNTIIQYHGHAGTGFAPASILEVARNGADYIDVAMEPLSFGTGHVDLLTAHAILKDAGFKVPDINMKAYMEVRSITQSFIDQFLGYYINPKNRFMNPLLIGPGLPGGMMGSLMADLESNLSSVNKSRKKRGKDEYSQDDLLVALFNEVSYIWPKMGYPPLVTPFSQYVKNIAMFNIIQMEKGKERFSLVDDNSWSMLLGRSGKLPGKIDKELIKLAEKEGKEFFTGNPQDLYPDNLDQFRKEMDDNGWDYGKDDEELFELAMHPEQYRAYKSGKAKADFEKDIAERREKSLEVDGKSPSEPKIINLTIDGEKYQVEVSYGEENEKTRDKPIAESGSFKEILAPLEGKFSLTKESSEKSVKVGDFIKSGDRVGYIESMKVFNPVTSEVDGVIAEICFGNGDDVDEDEVLIKVKS
ncbi:MAG: oxaloacetate decarboxylase [Candidatus Delongbacteria bacterium]|nr:MAG: oxaloacetate decarboxylase [Candidatus Delongbacteria bacterium]